VRVHLEARRGRRRPLALHRRGGPPADPGRLGPDPAHPGPVPRPAVSPAPPDNGSKKGPVPLDTSGAGLELFRDSRTKSGGTGCTFHASPEYRLFGIFPVVRFARAWDVN